MFSLKKNTYILLIAIIYSFINLPFKLSLASYTMTNTLIDAPTFFNTKKLKNHVNLSGIAVTSELLNKLSNNPNLSKLLLKNSNVQNDHLNIVSGLKLKVLDIEDNMFDDTGIQMLGKLRELENLDISANKITSKGIEALRPLNNLLFLSANYTYLGNQGIRVVSSFPQLEHLEVKACGFDDQALTHFFNMPNLKVLKIAGNKNLTKSGIQDFMEHKSDNLHVVLY